MTSLGCILVVSVLFCALVRESLAAFPTKRKRNCLVSEWSDWSSSNSRVIHKRTRTIMRKPKNGGKLCPTLTQTRNVRNPNPWSKTKSVVQKFNLFLVGNGIQAKHFRQQIGVDPTIYVPRDLLFIIDMSGSILDPDWKIMKEKVADLVGKLCGTIGQGKAYNRISIVAFSSKPVLKFNFKTYWTLPSVRHAILGMRKLGGMTCTGDAFLWANKYMFEPNQGIRGASESVKEVLVLTDGRSNCGAPLSAAVKKLRVKAAVFALAIGTFSKRGKQQIESMVSRPDLDHIFSLAYFTKFRDMVDALPTDECSAYQP